MMKKLVYLLALLLPLGAAAQTQSGARASIAADWKIRKGLHLTVEEEIRMDGVFQSLGRLQTTIGLEYKVSNYFRLGAGYVLINPYSASNLYFKEPRHRFYVDGKVHYNLNGFDFSLRERVQLTHRTGDFNAFQSTPNLVGLKTRLGVSYKGWTYFEPGVFFEMRTQLNAPWGSISGSLQTKSDGTTYYAYTPAGYTHTYNDRYRGIIRTDIKFNKHHVLRPYVLLDYISEYDIDTNSEGTRLFSAAYNNYFKVTIGVGYTFKF